MSEKKCTKMFKVVLLGDRIFILLYFLNFKYFSHQYKFILESGKKLNDFIFENKKMNNKYGSL